MMYYLHRFSDQFIGFNVFSYVTFRSVAAAVTAFVISLIFGNFVTRKLTALKLGQPIRLAAEVHRLAELHGGKQGTPTMGGVLIIGAVVLSSILWARILARSALSMITSRSRRKSRPVLAGATSFSSKSF